MSEMLPSPLPSSPGDDRSNILKTAFRSAFDKSTPNPRSARANSGKLSLPEPSRSISRKQPSKTCRGLRTRRGKPVGWAGWHGDAMPGMETRPGLCARDEIRRERRRRRYAHRL
eukprot:scaffold12988_cov112-Isochrysis_galbana.AAC.4